MLTRRIAFEVVESTPQKFKNVIFNLKLSYFSFLWPVPKQIMKWTKSVTTSTIQRVPTCGTNPNCKRNWCISIHLCIKKTVNVWNCPPRRKSSPTQKQLHTYPPFTMTKTLTHKTPPFQALQSKAQPQTVKWFISISTVHQRWWRYWSTILKEIASRHKPRQFEQRFWELSADISNGVINEYNIQFIYVTNHPFW